MTQYLVDTNHLSPLVTLGHPLRERIYQRLEAGDPFAIATPVLSELLFGIRSVPQATKNLRQWQGLRKYFAVYDVVQQPLFARLLNSDVNADTLLAETPPILLGDEAWKRQH